VKLKTDGQLDGNMHKVSDKTAQLAQAHAERALKHGQFVEAFGKRLLENDKISKDYSQLVEEYGQAIQCYARRFQLYIEALNDTRSPEIYDKAVQAHMEATNAHFQATQVYTQLVNLRSQRSKSHYPSTADPT